MKRLLVLISGCVALVACTACNPAFAQVGMGSATDWLDGKRLDGARPSPVSVSWTDSPLRNQLSQFAVQRQRPIFVDRRVDSNLEQTAQLFDVTTEQVIWRIANKNKLGVARIGSLFYVGPKDTASRLPFVIAAAKKKLSKLPKAARSKWNQSSDILWPEATTTTEIMTWFQQTHGIHFSEPVPLDVWPQTDWPRLTLLEQMSLFLVGFGLAFEFEDNGTSITLVPVPHIESGTQRFKLKDQPFDFGKAKNAFPGLKISKSGRTGTVKGSVELIAEFEAWVVKQQRVDSNQNVSRTFDINTTVRRGDILATVAQQTNRQLEFSGDVGDVLIQRITLKLEKAPLESLLLKCLEGTNLKYSLSNSKLTISPK